MDSASYLLAHGGEVIALFTSFLWACSTILYGQVGRYVRPIKLNLYKNVVGFVLVALTLLVSVLLLNGQSLSGVSPLAVVLLMSSGILGIGVGDTAYFESLKCLGVRKASLLRTLSPLCSSLLALIFLGENLKLAAWVGIALTLLGVIWVIAERTENHAAPAKHVWRGVAFGVTAAMAEGSGAVLTHKAMIASNISPMWGTFLRIIAAAVVLLIVTRWIQRPELGPSESAPRSIWVKMLVAILLGSFLGLILQQFVLRLVEAGIAQTLFSTSPLFVFLIVIALFGEKPTVRATIGSLLAITGIFVIFGFQ